MTNPTKITDEELNAFVELKTEFQKILLQLGELYLEKMEADSLIKQLSDKESSLRSKIEEMKTAEVSLMDGILKKYGEGGLNIKTGIFTPA
jgi:hypothetical protein